MIPNPFSVLGAASDQANAQLRSPSVLEPVRSAVDRVAGAVAQGMQKIAENASETVSAISGLNESPEDLQEIGDAHRTAREELKQESTRIKDGDLTLDAVQKDYKAEDAGKEDTKLAGSDSTNEPLYGGPPVPADAGHALRAADRKDAHVPDHLYGGPPVPSDGVRDQQVQPRPTSALFDIVPGGLGLTPELDAPTGAALLDTSAAGTSTDTQATDASLQQSLATVSGPAAPAVLTMPPAPPVGKGDGVDGSATSAASAAAAVGSPPQQCISELVDNVPVPDDLKPGPNMAKARHMVEEARHMVEVVMSKMPGHHAHHDAHSGGEQPESATEPVIRSRL